MQTLDAQVLCLQEFPLRKLEDWKRALKEFGYEHALAQKTCDTLLGIQQSNVIFSCYPLEERRSVDLTYKEHETRKAQYCLVDTGKEKVFVLNTHLGLRRPERLFQMGKIVEILSNHPDEEKMALVGDFNDWNNAGERLLGNYFQEAFSECHGKCAKTFPSKFPLVRLDRIYYRNLNTLACEVLSGDYIRKKSDHLPIRAVFDL